eukprot:508927-Amphidinium_carterae.1
MLLHGLPTAVVAVGGEQCNSANANLSEIVGLHPNPNARLALRCTRGPVDGAIGWHFDGGYATQTVQIALNDHTEYKGGR